MPQARLSLAPPEGTPLRDVATGSAATLRVVGASLCPDPAALLVSYRGSDGTEAVRRLRDHRETVDAAVLHESGDDAQVHCRAPSPSLAAVADAGVAVDPPLVVTGTRAELTARTTDEGLSALRRALEASAVGFDVRSVHASVESSRLLTDRQERVLRAAVERGYYDLPRDHRRSRRRRPGPRSLDGQRDAGPGGAAAGDPIPPAARGGRNCRGRVSVAQSETS